MTGTVSAGFGRRFAALLYDGFLLIALLFIYTALCVAFTPGHVAVTEDSAGAWYVPYRVGELCVIAGYYVVNWKLSGQTLGMRAWRLRTVSAAGGNLSVGRGVLRFACGFLAWPPVALGVLWLYLDSEHRAIHDRLSGTYVLKLVR